MIESLSLFIPALTIDRKVSLHFDKEEPMKKFFRKIRQRLLTDNKFSKYLIYSIGEIVLGILIALEVNNANEDRKSNLELVKIN